MDVISRMSRMVMVLMLAVGMPYQAAFAEEEPGQDAAAVSVDQGESSAADMGSQAAESPPSDTTPAESGASDPAANGDAANSGKDAPKQETKETRADTRIPSTNPNDANKHPAWRKREADKVIVDLPKIRRSMQQGKQ